MDRRNEQAVHQAAHVLINGGNQVNPTHQQRYSEGIEEDDQLTYTPTAYHSGQNTSIQMSDRSVCSSLRVPFSRRRRLFCLLTIFDFLLMVIFWLLCAQFLAPHYFGFSCQVLKYTFKTSMFDMVLISFWRMVFLLIVYGLIRSEKWYCVGLTTVVTIGIVICKIVLYDFTYSTEEKDCQAQAPKTTFADVIILIASFVIVWFELFILDFQVIKRERRQMVAAALSSGGEHSPLLNSHSSSNHASARSSQRKQHQQFYSPFDSPADSEQEDEEDNESSGKENAHSYGAISSSNFESLPNSRTGSAINLAASLQEQEFIQKSEDSICAFQEMLDQDFNWNTVKTLETATISICNADIALNNIIFKLEATFPVSSDLLFSTLWDNFENSVTWNPTVQQVDLIQEIGFNVQVIYTVSNSILVASRDFVSIRQHKMNGEVHVVSDIAVEHPSRPVTKEYVRGVNGLGGWVVEPDETAPHSARLRWYFNTDIKLKMCPQNLFRQVMSNSLGDIYQGLTKALQASSEWQPPESLAAS